ncbi:hypothetical protein AB0I28_06810 [Phytomonospora sp. NPDC050363]|uniref:hypothetical protein n=1 Tax=Phytomonospora sp. NPDC050363 TaxID=3155642 RepID=UPI0033EF8B52
MRKSLKAAAVAAAAAAVIVGFASPAAAKPTPGNSTDAWVCGSSRGGSGETAWVAGTCATKSGSGSVKAVWYPWDERMFVYDDYPNGYHTYAYLTVATHSADLPLHTALSPEIFDLDYAEGLSVNFWVCSSAQDNAACTPRIYTTT